MKLRTKRRLDALCALVILGVFALAGGLTWLAREREIAATRAQLANLAVALELYVHSTVSSIDRALVATGYALRLLPGHPNVSFADGSRVLADAVAQLGLPVSIYVADRDGALAYGSDGLRHSANARDRDYFRVHADNSGAGLYVSELLISRLDGMASLVFSRRIDDAAGAFAGVIVVSAPVSVFERDFSRIDTGRTGSVALGDNAGRLYARRPAMPEWVGKVVVRSPDEVTRLLDAGGDGVIERRSMTDGLMRLTGFRRIDGTRLVVTVSNSLEEQLAIWRLQAWIVGIVALGLGTGSLLLFTLLTRDLVRKTQLADDLRQTVAALEQSVRAEQSASEAKTLFLSSMSHELMTPLNGIYGAVQLWQMAEKDEGRRRLAAGARSSTERLNTALRDALAYANATSAPLESALAPFDLRALLGELRALFDAQPGSARCTLELATPLPDAPLVVRTDASALRDALRRSLDVAVRLAQHGGAVARPTSAELMLTPAPGAAEDGTAPAAEDAAVGVLDGPATRRAAPGGDTARAPSGPVGPGAVRVAWHVAPRGDGVRLTVQTAVAAGHGGDLARALQPFADPGRGETGGLHDAGLSLEVARLLAVRAGASLQVECDSARLAITLAVPA